MVSVVVRRFLLGAATLGPALWGTIGCVELPTRHYFLRNATDGVVTVSGRADARQSFRPLATDVAPGVSAPIVVYKSGEKSNVLLEQGLELRIEHSNAPATSPTASFANAPEPGTRPVGR